MRPLEVGFHWGGMDGRGSSTNLPLSDVVLGERLALLEDLAGVDHLARGCRGGIRRTRGWGQNVSGVRCFVKSLSPQGKRGITLLTGPPMSGIAASILTLSSASVSVSRTSMSAIFPATVLQTTFIVSERGKQPLDNDGEGTKSAG